MSYPALSKSARNSRHLLLGAATIALTVAAMSRPVAAQSFQGTADVVQGGASVTTTPTTTTVNIDTPVTVINWRPTDDTGTGTIVFQPVGTTALFQSANSANFTVLNRILPVDANGTPVITRAIRFDGTVNSQFGFGSGVTAGSIWFYTPGGIIVGSSATFNVGSLVLSTSDIRSSSAFVGNTGTINFTGTPNPASAITLENGAQVNALLNGSSYVALVAPRIVQNGSIEVDGSAALVAAEAVDITMDGGTGLFDIAVSTGTGDANGIVHGATGSTTGPASAGTGDPQRIYMMAIPKNAAISMLVNGNIGYTPAATATVQNGEVVLSAGYNIASGNVNLGEHATPVNNAQANITIGETSNLPTSFTSRVIARASGDLRASPGTSVNGPAFLSFSGSAFLFGDLSSVVETNNANEFISVGGDLLVSSRRAGQGGNAAVRVLGGLLGVGGDLTVDATSIGFSGQSSGINFLNPVGGDGDGGDASVVVTGGALRISGTTQVVARGIGGYGATTAGRGFGGTALVDLTGTNSQIQLSGGLDVQAGGFGMLSYLSLFGVNLDPAAGVVGGDGRGGSATVTIDDVEALTLPSIIINASGNGDNGGTFGDGGGANGGNGIGGNASLTVNNEALALPDLTVEATGSGGNGGGSADQTEAAGNGGSGTGGGAQIILSGLASLNPSNSSAGGMAVVANGNGGAGGAMTLGSTLDSGSGGAATGGTASIAITGSSQVAVNAISALADARTGSVGSSGTNFGGTGLAQGGIASILIDTNGTVDVPFLTASASTLTYQTSRTGSANGGSARIGIQNGTVTAEQINVHANTVIDTENGQNVGSANAMFAGDGTGGNASLSVAGGTLTANFAIISANGQAMGQNPDGNANIDEGSAIEGQLAGGNGRGGNAEFGISGGSAEFFDFVSIEASGDGGDGFINSDAFATQPATAGSGGQGIGGQARLSIFGGILTTPTANLLAEGTGGNGGAFWGPTAGNAGDGGFGQGGTAEFRATQDVFFINSLALSATGKGGVGGVSAVPNFFEGILLGYLSGSLAGGRGGGASGGRAALELDFDPVLASVTLDASGIGGAGGLGFTGGQGGNGFGGAEEGEGAHLELNFGDLSVDALVLRSNGIGGNGGRGTGGLGGVGGNGTGGDASVLARRAGSNLTTLDVLVQANGAGGNAGATGSMINGAAGGNSTGGNAQISIINSATADLGATRLESLARGGAGGSTLFAGEGAGGGNFVSGTGGSATGGNAVLLVDLGSAASNDIFVLADAQGGNSQFGGAGGAATGGTVSVVAVTGSINANGATATANARGGNAAATSTGGNATVRATGGTINFNTTTASANGETSIGAGGRVSVLAGSDAAGASGSLTLGDTLLTSDGFNGLGGTVTIDNDNNNATGGAIQFGQLLASAEGVAPGNATGGIFVRANQSDILVAGNADFFTSDAIRIDGIGQGTLAATGNMSAFAETDIVITHNGQPGLVDTVRGGIVSFFSRRNFDAQTGSIIRATNLADVQSRNGFVNVDQLFAVNNSNIEAGTDATLRNATITNGSLNISAGRILSNPPTWLRATATIQGAVTVSDQLVVNSGGDVVITGGAVIRSGNDVVLNSGDDIIIRNSTISSAQNVTTAGQIRLNVGAITPIDPISGEVRSIVIANSTLTSTGHDLNLAADAIDATTATINANRFTALINNAPATGVAGGNDGGLLAANCVQGNICLGAISTPTQISVGPATGTTGLANRVTMAGSLASSDIAIRARDGVTFTGPVSVAATNNLLVSVLNGPIDLTGPITLRGDNGLNLFAGAGAITAPNTALLSNGNIGLFANGLSLGSLDAGGVLNTINGDGSVATAGSLVTPGNVTVAGQLAVRGGAANINSGGAITTGSILTTTGNDVLLTSTGAQSLGNVNSGRDVVVNAAALTAFSITAQRNVNAVVSGSATLGTTRAAMLDLRAGQDATIDQLFAVNTSNIAAGADASIRNATITNGSLFLSAGGIPGNIFTWRRATATIQGAVTVSDRLEVNSGGDVVITGGAVIRSGNDVVLNSGDDIIIRNSTISSAQNVTTTGQIRLNAGAITPIDPISGEVRSIVIANSTLTSTGHDLNLAADAIDATTATINANRFTALINNAPAAGVAGGNDGGLLAANCVQGNICLGAISVPTQILVGPATGITGLANRVTMAGSLASNDISIRVRDAVAFTGPINITAANTLLVSVVNGPIDLSGAASLRGNSSLNLYAGAGAITGPTAALISDGNIGLFANGGVSLGSVDAGGVLNTINSDGSVATAGSFVTPGNVTVAGQLAVRGGAANINSGGAITTGSILTTTGNDVLLTSTGAQSLGTVNSGRDVVVNAAALTAFSVTAQRNVNAIVSGNLTLGTTRGALVDLRAGQDATFNSSVIAANAVEVRANSLATFRGTVNAPNITVRSGNIAIESEGQIGVVGTTQNITLTNSAGAQMTVGGSGVSAGYSLSSAEVARIFGNNIDIGWTANLATTGVAVSPPTNGFAQPSVVVDALTLTSRATNQSGNLAANGTFSVSTPGQMRVIGAVALNGAGTGNSIRLNAGQSLQIIGGQGSIAIRDGATSLAGLIDLTSADIIAASSSAITDIAAQTDPTSISTRLGRNDGATNDIGILSADRVTLNGGNNVLVQNSGAGTVFDERRGITANAINVTLTNANGLVVINGQITAAPGFATGLAAIPLLNINGTPSQTATGFNALSTMNGCQITAAASCSRQPENPASISVTTDDINRPLDPDQGLGADFPTSLIELKEFETFGYPPLIDEPVTGSGNDDLWPATCPPDDETCEASLTPPVGN